MLDEIKKQIIKLLPADLEIKPEDLVVPPDAKMGDLSLPCFGLAKKSGKNPAEVAHELELGIRNYESGIVKTVQATGPYLNFVLNPAAVAETVLKAMAKEKNKFGESKLGQGKKIMVEFAHPNTHKAVHIGHLRNIVTGESLVRIFEKVGFKVIRANYQGDVGMQVAKCLWGIERLKNEYEQAKKKTVSERVKFLGRAYALGAQTFEKDEQAKKEIGEYNKKIYSQDKSIKKIYALTRKWSLDYFQEIYKRLEIKKFDRLYFESEMPRRAVEIVRAGLKKGIFKESQGAVIFEGGKYGLHDRVFLNSQGLPVYESKDQALAEMQFKEYNPAEILHLVAQEQTEYFKVIFKALEFTLPQSIGREKHVVYGWVSLKEGKMSSRTGQVVLAEWLLDEVEEKIIEVMRDSKIKNKKDTARKVALAAVKYSILKTGVANNMVFDINESISLEGDSGPYLQYSIARINSIIKKIRSTKSEIRNKSKITNPKYQMLKTDVEKHLILKLAAFPEVVAKAAQRKDPSEVAKYVYETARVFSDFYEKSPVLKAESEDLKVARLELVKATKTVLEQGLSLLGIPTLKEM